MSVYDKDNDKNDNNNDNKNNDNNTNECMNHRNNVIEMYQ